MRISTDKASRQAVRYKLLGKRSTGRPRMKPDHAEGKLARKSNKK